MAVRTVKPRLVSAAPQARRASSKTHWVSRKVAPLIRPAKGGHGIFAIEPVHPGELIVMWGGDIREGESLDALTPTARRHSIQIEEGLYLVPHSSPEPGDYVNHSCDPNAGMQGQTALVALRLILPGEEVCYDYAMSDGSPYDEFICSCRTDHCRGRVTGNDWMISELQHRYAGFFSPYLQRRIEVDSRSSLRGRGAVLGQVFLEVPSLDGPA